MLFVLSVCRKDRDASVKLLEWIRELDDEASRHELLLVWSIEVGNSGDLPALIEASKAAFGTVYEFPLHEEDERGWPYSANHAWAHVCKRIANQHKLVTPATQPWCWLEADSIPVKAGWRSAIQAAYEPNATEKPFMGCDVNLPECKRHISGIAVYPGDVMRFTYGERFSLLNGEAWDTFLADDFLPFAQFTPLIQHVFWQHKNPDMEPTFPDQVSLDYIAPETVLFHRNKDGSLIERLREKKNGHPTFKEMVTGVSVFTKPLNPDTGIAILYKRSNHKTLFTYFSPVAEIDRGPASALIELWKTEWEKHGWKTVVLGEDDAKKHPKYAEAQKVWASFPCQNPRDYERHCYNRFLAMQMIGGGFLADYDVFPVNPDFSIPASDVQFYSGNERDPRIPCFVYATQKGYGQLVDHLLAHSPPDNKHTSDMIAFRTFKAQLVKEVLEYGEPGTPKAIHFSTHSMQPRGFMPKHEHIPRLLEKYICVSEWDKVKPEPTVSSHIAALVEASRKDGFAKGRIMKQLREAGFRVDEPPTMVKRKQRRALVKA